MISKMKELEKLDLDSDEVTKAAEKTLNELLKVCEEHDISKEGLIEEMREGLDPERDTGVIGVGKDNEVIDLDLEEIAMRGEKRLRLESDEEVDDAPRKLVEHDLEM